MTPKQRDRKSVARSKSADYARVADSFYNGSETAKEFEYWNAAGVRSNGNDHMGAIDLMREVVMLDDRGNKALRHLARIIEQKNLVSYSGEIYAKEDVDKLWRHLERYRDWAHLMLEK